MIGKKGTRLPGSLWILFTGVFINRFGSFVTIFLILYMASRGYSIAQAGLAVGFYGLGGFIASAAGGYLTDYLGRKNTIMLSMFSSAGAMLALSQVSALLLLILFVGLAGLTSELYRPAISALITDLVPPEQQVLAFAWNRLAINLGYTAGPAVAGFLASRSFVLVFAGDALTSITFGLIVLFALRVTSPVHKPASAWAESNSDSDTGKAKSFRQTVLHDLRFLIFLCAATAISFVYFQSQSTLVLQVTSLGFSSVTYGLLVSLNGLIVVFVELPLSMLTRRFAALPIITAGYVLVGIGIGLTAWALTVALLMVTVILWTLGEIIYEPMSSVYVARLAPVHMRGRYQGMFGLSWSIGLVLGPPLGSLLFAWNASLFWLLCGGLGLLAALLLWVGTAKMSSS